MRREMKETQAEFGRCHDELRPRMVCFWMMNRIVQVRRQTTERQMEETKPAQ